MKKTSLTLIALAICAGLPAFAQDGVTVAPGDVVVTDKVVIADEVVIEKDAVPATGDTIVLPATMPDGRTIWTPDPEKSEYETVSGQAVRLGGMIQKLVTDSAIADEMCQGGIKGTPEQATGCVVRDYLYTALADFDICEDRYLDEKKNAYVKVFAECLD